MELKLKVYLVDEDSDKFMGIGVLWLLQSIEREHSIRSAASALGISYSKAFGMLRNLESALGVSVLERRKGGDARDGAHLTPFGKQFIALYDQFQHEVKQLASERYKQFSQELYKEIGDDDQEI